MSLWRSVGTSGGCSDTTCRVSARPPKRMPHSSGISPPRCGPVMATSCTVATATASSDPIEPADRDVTEDHIRCYAVQVTDATPPEMAGLALPSRPFGTC